jgi:hypothetical protein
MNCGRELRKRQNVNEGANPWLISVHVTSYESTHLLVAPAVWRKGDDIAVRGAWLDGRALPKQNYHHQNVARTARTRALTIGQKSQEKLNGRDLVHSIAWLLVFGVMLD